MNQSCEVRVAVNNHGKLSSFVNVWWFKQTNIYPIFVVGKDHGTLLYSRTDIPASWMILKYVTMHFFQALGVHDSHHQRQLLLGPSPTEPSELIFLTIGFTAAPLTGNKRWTTGGSPIARATVCIRRRGFPWRPPWCRSCRGSIQSDGRWSACASELLLSTFFYSLEGGLKLQKATALWKKFGAQSSHCKIHQVICFHAEKAMCCALAKLAGDVVHRCLKINRILNCLNDWFSKIFRESVLIRT